MRGLAEFIMRGRWQALAVAVLGAGTLLFGWISAAAVALVTLRKGSQAGGWLVLWALLPAVLTAWMSGDLGGVLLLMGTFLLALVLRTTVSLALAVVTSMVVGFASGASLLLISGEFLTQLVGVFEMIFEQIDQSLGAAAETGVVLVPPGEVQIAGILAGGNAATAVLSLLLGRYWQALLYNPGGFRREFHALRYPAPWTLLLAGSALVLWYAGGDAASWALMFVVPLSVAGFALAHSWVAVSGGGSGRLTVFYVLWLLFDPVKGVLLAMVVIDALMDFRSRWRKRGTDQGV